MSALCGIELTIESLILLKKTLNELEMQYSILEELKNEEKKLFVMETAEGTVEKVNILVTGADGIRMGLQKQENGQYRVITSASSPSQLKVQRKMAGRIKQRYAYNRIKEELSSKGYSVVEEKKDGDNTIKLVARRWR